VFQLTMRASDALRAVAFHLSVEARVAVHAAVFPLAMRAGFALRAPVFYLAVRAGFARRAPVFHLAVRAGDARRAAAFDLAMRAGIALRAVVFQPAVRTRVALHAAGFLWLPVWAAFHFQFHTREFSAGTPRVSTVSSKRLALWRTTTKCVCSNDSSVSNLTFCPRYIRGAFTRRHACLPPPPPQPGVSWRWRRRWHRRWRRHVPGLSAKPAPVRVAFRVPKRPGAVATSCHTRPRV
jgi:hypothetical protein